MTWKSTAVASGLMVVATWLASYAPVAGPRPLESTAPTRERTEAAAAEIQREASRLHERLQQAAAFRQPARNPFRFSAPRSNPIPPHREPVITVEDLPAPMPVVPTLRVTLSGIAEDKTSEQVIRTAIISTPDDVFLATVGETIAGIYKVTAIEADSVELLKIDEGSSVRLTLKP